MEWNGMERNVVMMGRIERVRRKEDREGGREEGRKKGMEVERMKELQA